MGGCRQDDSIIDAASTAARSAGNTAYLAGDMSAAVEHYLEALSCSEKAMCAKPQPSGLETGQLVQYSSVGYFGTVMSSFPLFDEYFLKDLGSDQAIWVGDPGGNLRRFARKDLVTTSNDLVDFRLAVLQNLSAVCLRQEKWEEAVKWADLALSISGRAPKALMRKGSALLKLNQPGPASDVLATAAEEVPNDAEVRRLLREAEKKRSPTWVCATGCCGPWGIVCGGPLAQTVPEVVAPAKRLALEYSIKEEQGAEAAAEGPDGSEATVSKPTVIVDPMIEGKEARGVEPDEPPTSLTGKASGPTRESADGAIGEQEKRCRARGPLPVPASAAAPPVETAGSRTASLDKGVAGLLGLACGSIMVAMVAAMWMMSLPAEELM